MGLKLLKGPNGKLRATWYADIRHDGRTVRLNLGVPVRGTPGRNAAGNPTIHGGDRDFEASRREAEARFKKIREESKNDPASLIQKAYKVHTGQKLKDVRLDELPAKWRAIPREPPATEAQLSRADRTFADFIAFSKSYELNADGKGAPTKRRRRCLTLNAVTPEMALAYFRHARESLAWATAASRKHLLSSAWQKFSTSGGANPFAAIVTRRKEGDKTATSVKRKLLDENQLERLFELARDNDFLYPLVVCAASTGLRLGDVCNLRWKSVEFQNGRPHNLKVVTSKTGAIVSVPVFPRFAAVLEKRLAEREMEDKNGGVFDPFVYVFPAAAKKYSPQGDRSGLARAVKPLFARVVYGEPAAEEPEDAEPLTPAAVEAAIEAANWKDTKKARILDVFRRFTRGESYSVIRKETGRASALISQDLQSVELLVGRPIRPGVKPGSTARFMLNLTRERLPGRRAGSLYGWHSLRGSFSSLALERGMALEEVAAIVGHTTAKVTWEHYVEKSRLAEKARDKLSGSVLDDKDHTQPAPAALPVPAKASAIPEVTDPAQALRYVVEWILDEGQRERLDTAADAIGVDADNAAERLGLAARILAKDNQLDRALDGLRSARLLA